MVKTIYMPREREVRFEFVDGAVFVYEEIHKRDIPRLKDEAVKHWKANRNG